MNTCERCGGEVSPGARFCRQCGAPVNSETEAMLPQTRKYGHQVERRYPAPPEPEPPAWSYPGMTSSTSPFASHGPNPVYSVPQPRGSSTKFWISVVLLSLLLVMGVSSAAFWASNDRRTRARERAIEAQVEEQLRKKERDLINSGAEKAPIIAVPVPPLPPVPPHPATGNDEVDRLMYPDARITERTVSGPNSVIKMTSKDSLEDVRQFYETQLPNSTITSKGNAVTFVKNDDGSQTTVTLNKRRVDSPTSIDLVIHEK